MPGVELSAKTAGYSSTHSPLGTEGLWKHKGWQLPAYIQNVAKGVLKTGKTRSEAIAIAIGTVRKWASGGGDVSAEVRAASAKAIAEWEALKARSGGGKGGKIAASHTDARAVTLAATWNEAAHPRLAAGATGGGQFTSGQGGSSSSTEPKTATGKGAKSAGKGSKTDAAAQALWDRMAGMSPAQQAAYLASLSPAQLLSLGGAAFAAGQPVTPAMVAARTLVAGELSKRGLTLGDAKKATKSGTASKKSSGSSGSKSSGGSSSGSSKSSGSSSSKKSGSSGSTKKASTTKPTTPTKPTKSPKTVPATPVPPVTPSATRPAAPPPGQQRPRRRQRARAMAHRPDEQRILQLAAAPDPGDAVKREMARNGIALPDGSYRIPSRDFLMRAIQAYGRCPEPKRAALVAHIRRRARALGAIADPKVQHFLSEHSGA